MYRSFRMANDDEFVMRMQKPLGLEEAANVGVWLWREWYRWGYGLWRGLLLLIALVAGGASILSLLERVQHGPGLLFADGRVFSAYRIDSSYIGRSHVYSLPRNCLLSRNSSADLAALLFKSPTGAWLRVCVISGSCLLWGWFLRPWKTGLFAFADKD